MSDTVYAIASGKGGVGKTTTAINLGAMLAERDHSVVVVDTDLGMANLADFLDFEIETPTLHEVLAGDADPEKATYRAPGDIDVLPSATDIEAFVKSDPANLQEVVADLREEYDYVLLDTGAGVSYDTLVPLALADGVLLVATPDVASVRDTAKTGELAERVETEVRGAVLTQRSSDILNADDVEETLGTDVLAVIPQDEAVPMGIDAGRPLASFAPNAPAGQAYRDLSAVLTGEADPDPALESVAEGEDDSGQEIEPQESEEEAPTIEQSDTEWPDHETESESASADSPESVESGDLAEADVPKSEPDSPKSGPDSPESESAGSESGDSDPADAGSADDPLSADAAQNVRDAIGSAAGGDADSLFAGQRAGQTPDSAEGAQAPEAGTGESETDESATDQNATDESADEDDSTGLDGESGARSVDDLINEHISDERLGGDSDGDDPLAEMSDGASGESADSDDERNPLRTEDPFAEEDEGTGEGAADERAGEERTAEEGTDETGEWDGDEQSHTADDAGVPFENRERSAPSSAAGQQTGGSTGDDSPAGGLGEKSPEGDGDSPDSSLEPDSSDEEESGESGGVLGRLGSLFR